MTFNIQKTKLQRKHYLQGLKTIKNKIKKDNNIKRCKTFKTKKFEQLYKLY